jgi:hypothetical protein
MKQDGKQVACPRKIAQRDIKRAARIVAASALLLGGSVGDALAVSLSTTGTGGLIGDTQLINLKSSVQSADYADKRGFS